MSVCKSRVANVSVQATRDVYFREHGGWIVMWFVFANQHLPIQVNGKIDGIKRVIEKDRDGDRGVAYTRSTAWDRYRTVTVWSVSIAQKL